MLKPKMYSLTKENNKQKNWTRYIYTSFKSSIQGLSHVWSIVFWPLNTHCLFLHLQDHDRGVTNSRKLFYLGGGKHWINPQPPLLILAIKLQHYITSFFKFLSVWFNIHSLSYNNLILWLPLLFLDSMYLLSHCEYKWRCWFLRMLSWGYTENQ